MKKTSLLKFISLIVFSAFVIASCASNKIGKSGTPLKQDPALVTGKLDNGMSYYVLPNGEPTNRIYLRLVVKAGSCMETESEKGVAHFVEHMCFNGTEHFEKNTLIDYAESIGMSFGPEVNAYTSFEETVYMFEIPADKSEYLDQALLICHDWASAVTFDPVELDKERGVIVEEWRGSLGLGRRLSDAVFPFEVQGSGYVDHFPIGHMDVIQNISCEDVKAFYKKWYRPENISVVVSGVCDSKVISHKIKEVMGTIPASDKPVKVPSFSVPPRKEKDICIFKDPEMPYVNVSFALLDEDFKGRSTYEEFKKIIEYEILNSILDMRLAEITQSPESPWLDARSSRYNETNTVCFNGFAFVPKDGMFIPAMKTLFDEYDRFLIFGATESELNRVKETILTSEENWYEQRGSITSDERCSRIINQILIGKTYMSDDDIFQCTKTALEQITLEDLMETYKTAYEDRCNLCMIYAPQNAELPSEAEIMDLWKNYQNAEIAEYTDDVPEGELMARPATKAEIVSKNELKDLSATEYVLSNGIKIITKYNAIEKNKICFKAISKGGLSVVSEEDFPSACYSPMYKLFSGVGEMSITQLQKYLSDKNIGVNILMNQQDETILAESTQQNLEDMFQLVYVFVSEPKFSDEGWNQVVVNSQQSAKMYGIHPVDLFVEKINQTLYGNSIRYSGVNQEFVDKIDRAKCERIYKERFCNPSDFIYTFTGDFDEEKLLELCCYYLGNMQNSNISEESVYFDCPFPKGVTVESVKKETEHKCSVFLAFGGELPAAKSVEENWKDDEMMEQLRQLLDIRLREVIREDKSGTYGVSVSAGILGKDKRRWEIQINFDCEPERKDELKDEVLAALETLKKEEVTQINLDKLHEAYRRSFELNSRSNYWWQSQILSTLFWNNRPVYAASDDTSVIKWTTAKELKALANKYFNTDNYVCIYLEPEF